MYINLVIGPKQEKEADLESERLIIVHSVNGRNKTKMK